MWIFADSGEEVNFLSRGEASAISDQCCWEKNSFWSTRHTSELRKMVKSLWCVCFSFKLNYAFLGQARTQSVQRKQNFMWYFESKQKQEIPATFGKRTSSLEKFSLSFPYWMSCEWFEWHSETHVNHLNLHISPVLHKVQTTRHYFKTWSTSHCKQAKLNSTLITEEIKVAILIIYEILPTQKCNHWSHSIMHNILKSLMKVNIL